MLMETYIQNQKGPITMKVVGTMSAADASLFFYVGERALYLT